MDKKISRFIFFIVLFVIVSLITHILRSSNLFHKQLASLSGIGQFGTPALYPNRVLTPGSILTTDATTICQNGYSHSVRNVSVDEKRAVYDEYGILYPQSRGSYEVDHFIPLELGGANDIKNLWPEPAEPKPGFHEKDEVENYLHEQVCLHRMSLIDAQKEIVTDWYAVYKGIYP